MSSQPTGPERPGSLSAATSTVQLVRTFKVMAAALAVSPVLIVAAMVVTLPVVLPDPWWPVAVPVVCGLLAHLLALAVGYRVQPVDPALPQDSQQRLGVQRFVAGSFTRFAVAEAPVLIGLALGFVAQPPSLVPALAGLVVSLALLALHHWPSLRNLTRVQTELDSAGARTRLAAAFGKG